jgi:hypothetical protein
MKFIDLLELTDISEAESVIDCKCLQKILPNTPLDVIEQFYSDHGENPDYQDDYQNIDISNLVWEELYFSAEELSIASINSECRYYFDTVKTKASWVKTKELSNYKYNEEIVGHWKKNMTWCRPPIFLCGSLISSDIKLRLAEGHTRLGSLAGFLESGIIKSDSQHIIWLGSPMLIVA